MSPTVIKNLRRDKHGNFAYRGADDTVVNVAAGTPAAGPLESFWEVCQQIHAEQHSAKALSKTKSLFPGFARFGQWLLGLFKPRKKVGQLGQPAPASYVGWGVNPTDGGRHDHTPNNDHGPASPSTAAAPTPRSAAPSPAPAPKPSPAVESDRPDFEVEEIRRLPDGTGFFVRFAEGIEVSIPNDSPHAPKFESAFKAFEKIAKSVAALDPAAELSRQAVKSDEPKIAVGRIVAMPVAASGKPRYGFEQDGKVHPIKLTTRETTIVKTLVDEGKLKNVAVVMAPATIVTLEGLELEEGGQKKSVNFRAFVQDVAKSADAPPATSPASATPEVAPPAPAPQPDAVTNPPPPAREVEVLQPAGAPEDRHPADSEHVSFEDLPARSPEGPVAPAVEPSVSVTEGSPRVLVADENPETRQILVSQLQAQGIEVDVAENGPQALAAIDARRHRIVFLDLEMPQLDGFELGKTSQGEMSGGTRVVALVGAADEPSLAKVNAAGLTSHLLKPVTPEALQSLIEGVGSPAVKPVSSTTPLEAARGTPPPVRVEIEDAVVEFDTP